IERVNALIKEKVDNPNVKIEKNHDRLYLVLNGEDYNKVILGLNKVSGLSSYSLVSKSDRDVDSIFENALNLIKSELKGKKVTFKVETKRSDKNYPLKSPEITQIVAAHVLKNTDMLVVDVHEPELVLRVEVRLEAAFVYCKKIKGMGGFPVGVAGKGLLMLSGGIDSPVAGFLAMKQGIEIEGIHFESTPLTSIESAQKVIDLTRKLAVYAPHSRIRLHMVPFMELHTALIDYIPEAYNITIMRRMMYRIAEKIALKSNCIVLLNGESVGQVASQTLKSMSVINDVVNMPVIRPLATYDKIDITHISKKIDCYQISIKPFEDCCTVYLPKKPTTAPKLDRCEYYESKYNFDALVDKTVENTKAINIYTNKNLDITMLGLVVSEVI
ncbi:MAG: tRNA 4-thiouridine(8) synthase ThiI, partial [Candidatus Izimaplasma sp.]|nr:tRNA 4-thiouridine(8) synthase ThiI [Candidatus Izimaplasma bacterium]